MKKRTVFAVLLIFLFSTALLYTGLNLCERALLDVSGKASDLAAFTLEKKDGTLLVTFAGRRLRLPSLVTLKIRCYNSLEDLQEDDNAAEFNSEFLYHRAY